MKTSNSLKWVCVAALLASTGANAASYTLGVLTPTTAVPMISAVLPAGAYSDEWSFSLAADADANGINVSSQTALPFNLGSIGATITSYELWNTTTNSLLASATPVASPGSGGTTGYQASFAYNGLVSTDTYAIKIGGNVGSFGAGIYTGSLTVSAVPELEEWAMMILGMGLIALRLKGSRTDSHSAGMPIFA